MASAVLFERKSCSSFESTLKAACRTVGDKAFHVEELPAKWVKTGLPMPIQTRVIVRRIINILEFIASIL